MTFREILRTICGSPMTWRTLLIRLLGSIVAGIGASVLVMYFNGAPWASAATGVVPMASPTAVCFVLIGIALMLVKLCEKEHP